MYVVVVMLVRLSLLVFANFKGHLITRTRAAHRRFFFGIPVI